MGRYLEHLLLKDLVRWEWVTFFQSSGPGGCSLEPELVHSVGTQSPWQKGGHWKANQQGCHALRVAALGSFIVCPCLCFSRRDFRSSFLLCMTFSFSQTWSRKTPPACVWCLSQHITIYLWYLSK